MSQGRVDKDKYANSARTALLSLLVILFSIDYIINRY